MKHSGILLFVACTMCMLYVGCCIVIHTQSCRIEKLEKYHEAAEMLLDDLDREYDWVDAFDPMEYYDAVEALED